MEPPKATFSDGAAYERLMGRWTQIVGGEFLDWLALAKGGDWLDVGCGTGALTELVAEGWAPRTLSGIDPSETQLAYARARPTLAHADLRLASAEALPYADGSFDAVVMGLVIAFVPDQKKAIAEMARVTRPGGTCATYMWDLPGGGLPMTPVLRALAEMGHPISPLPGAALSTAPALDAAWRAAGFQDVASRTISMTVSFRDFDEFWEINLLPAGPHARMIATLDTAGREALKERLRKTLPTDASGRIAYPSFAGAVKGTRAA